MHRGGGWIRNVRKSAYADSKPESEYQDAQVEAIRAWVPFLTADASLFYNHKNRYRAKQVVSPWTWLALTGAKVRQEIVWRRPGSVAQNARMFLPCDERIFWLYFGDDFYFCDSTEIKSFSSVWDMAPHVDRDGSRHPCVFPVELPGRVMRACSELGDLVFEPYAGSGTTLIVAEQLDRTCLAMELDPGYCDVVVQRWERLTGEKARKE